MDISVAIIIVLLIAASKCFSHVERIDCTESPKKPSEEALKQKHSAWLGEDGDSLSSFDLIPPLYKTRYKESIPGTEQILRQRIYGRAKCYKKLKINSEDVMDISLCPWYVEMTFDKERYPEFMANARCTCKHCYNFDGLRPDGLKRFETPRCIEIKKMHKVLRVEKNRKGDPVCNSDNNTILYKNSYEEVTIGCTCAINKAKTVKGPAKIKTEMKK